MLRWWVHFPTIIQSQNLSKTTSTKKFLTKILHHCSYIKQSTILQKAHKQASMKEAKHQRSSSNESILLYGLKLLSIYPENDNSNEPEMNHEVPASIASFDLSSSSSFSDDDYVYSDDDQSIGMDGVDYETKNDNDDNCSFVETLSDNELMMSISNTQVVGNNVSPQVKKKCEVSCCMSKQEHDGKVKLLLPNNFRSNRQDRNDVILDGSQEIEVQLNESFTPYNV